MVAGMWIDCDTCRMRDTSACDECVVTVLCGGGPLELGDDEQEALRNLADVGLCPPLRLVPGGDASSEPRPVDRAGLSDRAG